MNLEYDRREIEVRVRHSGDDPWTVKMSLDMPSALCPPRIQRLALEDALKRVMAEALDRLFADAGRYGGRE